jgi:quercetin dioxygenase-like cupin family protein
MKLLTPVESAHAAAAPNPARPATAVLLDTADARLIVFRLSPGQSVPTHRNVSSVLLSVLAGSGFVSGELDGEAVERACAAGDLIAYEPNEAHSMRATDSELLLLATITPRPGERNANN